MKKKDKKQLVLILLLAFVSMIIFMTIQGLIKLPKISSKNHSSNLGSITSTAKDYDYTQEYEWQYDEVIESDNPTFTNIQNLNLVSNNLTLQAIEDLDIQLSDYLVLQGYSDKNIVTLTIIETSIVDDRSYPYFEMKIENEDDIIKAQYDLPNYKWVFKKK